VWDEPERATAEQFTRELDSLREAVERSTDRIDALENE